MEYDIFDDLYKLGVTLSMDDIIRIKKRLANIEETLENHREAIESILNYLNKNNDEE